MAAGRGYGSLMSVSVGEVIGHNPSAAGPLTGLPKLPALSQLDTPITAVQADELQRAMPGCTITRE